MIEDPRIISPNALPVTKLDEGTYEKIEKHCVKGRKCW